MDAQTKLEALAEAAQYDLSCSCGTEQGRTKGINDKWIYPAALPNGGIMPMLKVLQAGGCERNCAYCAQRAGGMEQQVNFTCDELSKVFNDYVKAKMVGGLFLSSAIQGSPVKTMDTMLATIERVRFKHRFRGFIHLKLIPGAENSQIVRAMELANRVSINLETPNSQSLKKIAPGKNWNTQLRGTMKLVSDLLSSDTKLRCKSHTTQFVVGAAKETDHSILQTLWDSYQNLNLGRGFFSAFQPIEGTPLEGVSPTPLMREHRLYQTDFLFRKYGFSFDELIFDDMSNLSLVEDPKSRWANAHPEIFPLEINSAPKKKLLRVPGLGPTAVDRIQKTRKTTTISQLDTLKRFSPRWRTAAPYLLFNGYRRAYKQLSLW